MEPPTVFLSYSHVDEVWKDRLEVQLKVLQFEGVLDVWSDRDIKAGSAWLAKIEAAIDNARVAVLLVSAEFLISGFVREIEIPRCLERRHQGGLQVVPVLVKPCLWKKVDWLSRIQIRPGDNVALSGLSEHEIDLALMRIVGEIDNLLQEVPRPLPKNVARYLPMGGPVADCEDPLQGVKPPAAGPLPKYENDEMRDLSCRLKQAYQRKEAVVIAGQDTEVEQEEILRLRREIRKGGQLRAGDLLANGCRVVRPSGPASGSALMTFSLVQ